MSILITWAVITVSMFVASQMLTRMKIKGGVWNHFVVSALFGVLMVVSGWIFYAALGFATGGLLFMFSFVGKVLTAAIVLKLTDLFSDRLEVKGFGTAIVAALIMNVSGAIAELILSASA